MSKSSPGIWQALAQWRVDSKDYCLLGAQLSSGEKIWIICCGRWERRGKASWRRWCFGLALKDRFRGTLSAG